MADSAVNLAERHCKPCEGGILPLTEAEEDEFLKQTPSWTVDREKVHKIKKEFKFKDFKEAISFVNKVAALAEEEGHHPDIHVFYNKVRIELHTYAIKGLFDNDFIMAAKIDLLPA
jgi:4a-hydroxytetrahydrobiopterin dehydratase